MLNQTNSNIFQTQIIDYFQEHDKLKEMSNIYNTNCKLSGDYNNQLDQTEKKKIKQMYLKNLKKLNQNMKDIVYQNSGCTIIKSIINLIYFHKIGIIHIGIQSIESTILQKNKRLFDSQEKYKIAMKYVEFATRIRLMNRAVNHNTNNTLFDNLPKVILLYYQFIYIKQKIHNDIINKNILIINNLNTYKDNDEFIKKIDNLVDITLKNDIINNNINLINELKNAIRYTPYKDIYENTIIFNYICKIIAKIFPNHKNIHGKYYEAINTTNQYGFLSLDTSNLDQSTLCNSEKQIMRNNFGMSYKQYMNTDVIKEYFHFPSLELEKNKYNLNHLFHECIFEFLSYQGCTEEKIKKYFHFIALEIYQYLKIMSMIVDNNKINLLILNRSGCISYQISKLGDSHSKEFINKSWFINYFVMVYIALRKEFSMEIYSSHKKNSHNSQIHLNIITANFLEYDQNYVIGGIIL